MTNWGSIGDGEYNEQVADLGGVRVTIYSDRGGLRWSAYVGDDAENYMNLEARTAEAARAEVKRLAHEGEL